MVFQSPCASGFFPFFFFFDDNSRGEHNVVRILMNSRRIRFALTLSGIYYVRIDTINYFPVEPETRSCRDTKLILYKR